MPDWGATSRFVPVLASYTIEDLVQRPLSVLLFDTVLVICCWRR